MASPATDKGPLGRERTGYIPARIVHLHVSRYCNLRCEHCYSASGPEHRDHVDPDRILAALGALRDEGYAVLSLSGGEPLLYPGLHALLHGAKDLGFRINMVSNGFLVDRKRIDLIEQHVDLVAISLDGAPDTHNEIRRHPHAFSYASKAMDLLRETGIPFGVAFCVSDLSLQDMPWAYEFAVERGASLLQFHPFAATGRGESASRLALSDADVRRAYVVASLLRRDSGPAVHIDLAPVEAAQRRAADYRLLSDDRLADSPLSELVSPLIIDETGSLLPFCYGASTALRIGRAGTDVGDEIQAFKREHLSSLGDLLREALATLPQAGLVDWFHHLSVTSHSSALARRAGVT